MKNIIKTENAPKAIGPYSQAVEINGTVYVSGQLGINPQTGALQDGIEGQARQALENISAILGSAGLSLADVVKCTVLLENIEDFKAMNGVYTIFFSVNPPARAAYSVKKLPMGALVEIEAIAVRNK